MPPAYKKNLSQKPKPQIKTFQPPAQGAHWFQVQFGCSTGFVRGLPKEAFGGIEKRDAHIADNILAAIWAIRIFALSARDAHYQLGIQMEALGWTEGQNWRVTMICPEAEK